MSLESAICIGCGCSDDEPCEEGCSWLRVDYLRGEGVCSSCPEFEAAFDAEACDVNGGTEIRATEELFR